MHELVLSPAGVSTAVDATEPMPPGTPRATGHFWTPDGPLAAPPKQLSFLVGAGSLWATPRDLFKVVRKIADGGYGAPAVAGAQAANGAVQWTGFTNGFSAIVDYTPSTGVTLILTGNLLTGATDWISRDVPRLLSGEAVGTPIAPRPSVVALPDTRRKQLEGTYSFGGDQQLTFVNPTTALLGGEYVLVTTGVDAFYAPQNYATYAVVSDSTGSVVELRLQAPNGFAIPPGSGERQRHDRHRAGNTPGTRHRGPRGRPFHRPDCREGRSVAPVAARRGPRLGTDSTQVIRSHSPRRSGRAGSSSSAPAGRPERNGIPTATSA